MTDNNSINQEKRRANIARRYKSEKRFRFFGILAVTFALSCVLFLFADIISKGMGAFTQTYIKMDISFDSETLGIIDTSNSKQIESANYEALIKKNLRDLYPQFKSRREKRALYSIVSSDTSYQLKAMAIESPELIGNTISTWLIADDDVDVYYKHAFNTDKDIGRLSDQQKAVVKALHDNNQLEKRFNKSFFTNADSREPELAGIKGAVMGSIFTLLITLALSFPVGVATAIYLEEFAPKNKFTDFIEVNINNLAAVPSVIFGLLGLAIFINFFGMPLSIPLVGGCVLSLMTLPTIIISSRAAIKAVPPSIREAALGMGASKMQMVLHHVLPLAMPGMLTGTIIGMAQALGETAPLLMIGMVAFIVDVPGSVTDAATVLPVQIYLWADSPERAFLEKTSAAIMVLLGFLVFMNSLAVILRKRLERRW